MKKTINKQLLPAAKKGGIILQIVLITSSICILFIFCYWIFDRIIAAKRLKENQIAWDEYSKNMSKSEKDDCYLEWCNERKMQMGWRFFYFPQK